MDLVMAERARIPQIAAEFRLSPPQVHALRLLEPEQPLPMGRLACALGCDASNVTGIVDRLEQRGLIERRPSDRDRRVKVLVVTTSGREGAKGAHDPAGRAAAVHRVALPGRSQAARGPAPARAQPSSRRTSAVIWSAGACSAAKRRAAAASPFSRPARSASSIARRRPARAASAIRSSVRWCTRRNAPKPRVAARRPVRDPRARRAARRRRPRAPRARPGSRCRSGRACRATGEARTGRARPPGRSRARPPRARTRAPGRRPRTATAGSRRRAHTPSLRPRARSSGTSAANASPAATKNERENAWVAARLAWSVSSRLEPGVLGRVLGARVLRVEHRAEVGQAVPALRQRVGDRLPEVELGLDREARVDDGRSPGPLGRDLLRVEVGREERRQDEEAEDDAAVPERHRPSSVQAVGREAAERSDRQRAEGQREAAADQDLRRERPHHLGVRQDRRARRARRRPGSRRTARSRRARTARRPTR